MAPKRKNSAAASVFAFVMTCVLALVVWGLIHAAIRDSAPAPVPSVNPASVMYDVCDQHHGGVLDVSAQAGYAIVVCVDGTVLRG